MFMNLNKSGRILGVAFALAVIIPVGIAEAASNGGRGGRGGGGGGGGGEGGGPGPGETPLSFILAAPPNGCTAGAACPQITYTVKKEACEIRTCETENGVRKCSTEMTDIKVCVTKRS